MKGNIKKLIPILLSAVMCGSLFAGCANDNGNDNDDQHTGHTWSTTYVSDGESGHHRTSTCTEHEPVNDTTTAHVYDDDRDATCNNCDYVREITPTPPAHTSHDYKYTDESDTQHRKTCEGCSEVNELENHTYDNDRDTTCNDCDHIRVVTPAHTSHKYVYTSNGASGHTITCEGCSEVNETVVHTYDNEQDTTCNDCDYIRTVEQPAASTPLPAGKKIYVVGDSTVCSFNDNYYLPRYGYGTQLAEYLNVTSDQIVNLAISGRSSKSFLTESNYTTLKTSIAEGDYLIIGFGHNDEKSDEAARYTDANGTYTQATTANGDSFAYVLYENYVKMAKDKGATPILCTPIVRYSDKNDYATDKAHNTTNTDKLGKGGDYAAAIKTLGEATNTTVIDLTSLTKAVYTANNEEAKYFHAHTSYSEDRHEPTTGDETPSGIDGTHINKYGAKMVAYQFANALKATDSTLKAHVKDGIAAPTKAVDYEAAKNLSYVKPAVTAFDPSKYAGRNLTGDWYRTVIGNIGGKKAGEFTISYSENVFTVGNKGKNNGKFDSSGDGFAAAFMQIDKNKNFSASATVTVKAIGTDKPNQSAFGMMLRDDIYIDGEPADTYTGKEVITTNYVSASALGDGSGSLLSREKGTLSKGGSVSVAVGSSYEISILRVGQTVTVKFGNQTKTFTDFDFVATDNDYMYLCLFANRGLEVEFSNVQFEITGESQGA